MAEGLAVAREAEGSNPVSRAKCFLDLIGRMPVRLTGSAGSSPAGGSSSPKAQTAKQMVFLFFQNKKTG